MNKLAVLASSLLITVSSISAHATPTQYEFNVPVYAGETNLDGSSIASGDYLFAAGTTISGTFSFDSALLPTASNLPPNGEFGPTGPYSIYQGAVQNLSGAVGGHTFSAASGDTVVADSNPVADHTVDGVFNRAGKFNGGNIGTGFSGFTLGAYTLVSFDLYTIGSQTYLSSQALPSPLTNGEFVTGANLIFEDESHNQRMVEFGFGNIALTEVPLPATAWLFGSSALVLLGRSRKRAA